MMAVGDNGPKEGARAVTETAKLGQKALEVSQSAGGYVSRVLSTLPEDAVGVIGTDWLHEVRIRNRARMAEKTERILSARGRQREDLQASPTVLLPLIRAGQDESREELQELFARLIANAMDNDRTDRVRRMFIDTISQMEPVDAQLFQLIFEAPTFAQWKAQIRKRWENVEKYFASQGGRRVVVEPDKRLNLTRDELQLSIDMLTGADCITDATFMTSENGHQWLKKARSHASDEGKLELMPTSVLSAHMTALGRELKRALEL